MLNTITKFVDVNFSLPNTAIFIQSQQKQAVNKY